MNPTSEQRRRGYLSLLGIPLWVARQAPPAATVPVQPETEALPENPQAAPPQVETKKAQAVRAAPQIADMDWRGLQQAVAGCERCELHATRTQTVFGVGHQDAQWLFVGEAPGAEEDRLGEPFVGRAGQLLNAMLAALGLKREQVYIANVLKCRPPQNRDPQPQEVQQCEPYLLRQIELLRPSIIVALGRHAAHSLLKTDLPLGRLRGHAQQYHHTPLVVTYHPAYLLRNPADKAKAWQDLCLAANIVGAA